MEISFTRVFGGLLALVAIVCTIIHSRALRRSASGDPSGRLLALRDAANAGLFITAPSLLIFLFWPSAPTRVVVGVPAFAMAFTAWRFRYSLRSIRNLVSWGGSTTRWREQPIDFNFVAKARGALRLAHISDLHLSTSSTLEGEIKGERTQRLLSSALGWIQAQSPDFVAITGDITDAGETSEWHAFQSILSELPAEMQKRILYVPGNHDLTTLRTLESRGAFSGYQFIAEEEAAYGFVRRGLATNADLWKVLNGNACHTLLETFSSVQAFMDCYDRNRPRISGPTELRSAIAAELTLSTPDKIRELVPSVILSQELRNAVNAAASGAIWPTKERFLMRDLARDLYPMVFQENEHFIIVGLNSCAIEAEDLISSAFGRVGPEQLSRLSDLLQRAQGKCKIVLLHHHIAVPERLQRNRQLDWLRLSDAERLTRILQRHGPALVFHGHKHIGYHSICGSVQVFSSSSLLYGDQEEPPRPNCVVYDIESDGTAVVTASRLFQ